MTIRTCAWEVLHPSIGPANVKEANAKIAKESLHHLIPNVYSAWLNATPSNSPTYRKLLVLKFENPKLFNYSSSDLKERDYLNKQNAFWEVGIFKEIEKLKICAKNSLHSHQKTEIEQKIKEFKPFVQKTSNPTILDVLQKNLKFLELKEFSQEIDQLVQHFTEIKFIKEKHNAVVTSLIEDHQNKMNDFKNANDERRAALKDKIAAWTKKKELAVEQKTSVTSPSVEEAKKTSVEASDSSPKEEPKKITVQAAVKVLTPEEKLDKLLAELNVQPLSSTAPLAATRVKKVHKKHSQHSHTARKTHASVITKLFGWISELFKPRSASQTSTLYSDRRRAISVC